MNLNDQHIQLFELYDVWYTPLWQRPIIYIPLLLICLSLIFWFAYILYKKLLLKKQILTPDQQALHELDYLKIDEYCAQNEQGQFYVDISRILKSFFSKHFGRSFYGKTDIEVIYILESLVPEEVLRGLKDIFDGSLFVKFAQSSVARSRMKQDLEGSKAVVLGIKKLEGLDTSGKLREQ